MATPLHRDDDDPGRPKPGYIAILAGAAVLILVIGAILKPEKLAPESPAPLSETAPLQALSQRIELRDMADFLSGRVSAIGSHLVYLDESGASGVAWASPDSVITSGTGRGDSPVITVLQPRDTAATPVLRTPAARPARRGWVIVAARRRDGTLVSTVGMSGGETSFACGERAYRELVLAMPLPDTFQGGGIFDLEGNLVGVVGHCGERLVALSAVDIGRALTAAATSEARLLRAYGLRVTVLDEPARRYFAVDSGVLVTEVVLGRLAHDVGLRPGDVIVAVDSLSLRTPEGLAAMPMNTGPGQTVAIVRNGRPTRLSLSGPTAPSPTSLGLDLASGPQGFPLAGVEPGSRADRAGLRAGDRLLQIGRLQPRTSIQARRALDREDQRPVFLVYLRGDSERGVLLH